MGNMPAPDLYSEDIADEEWPAQLLTEHQFVIAKAIFRATDQRLRRIIAGPEGLRLGGLRIRAGQRVWYIGAPLPPVCRGLEGFHPNFSLWHLGQFRSLASMQRKGMVVEDPEHPLGNVLMLADHVKNYVGEWLMCCLRLEQQRRAQLPGFFPRGGLILPQAETCSNDEAPGSRGTPT